MKVAMFLRNPCTHDARVMKEAKSLSTQGHEVTVIAVMGHETPGLEEYDGFQIIRVPVNPLHYRLLRRCRGILALFRRWAAFRRRSQAYAARVVGGIFQPLLQYDFPRPDGDNTSSIDYSTLAGHQACERVNLHWFKVCFALAVAALITAQLFLFLTLLPLWLVLSVSLSSIRFVTALPQFLYERLCLVVLARPIHTWFLFLDYAARAQLVANKLQPEVCHAHDLSTLPIAYLVSRSTGSRLVYDSHEINTEMGFHARSAWIVKWWSRCYEGFIARRADAVITVNESIAGILSRWYNIALPCVVMNCPTKTDNIKNSGLFHRELTLPSAMRIVLYHGNLSAGRGLEQMVRAAKHLPADICLVVMGAGPLREELGRIVAEEEVAVRVRFKEPVSPAELPPYVASADLGIVLFEPLELNNYLASPNKIFDYLMGGVPVIASDLPELNRLVVPLGLGGLVDQGNASDIARGVVEVLGSDDYREMCKRARRAALEDYNWENQSKGLSEIYSAIKVTDLSG